MSEPDDVERLVEGFALPFQSHLGEGFVETLERAKYLQDNCSICSHRNPVIFDELVAEPIQEQSGVDRYKDVRALEAMSDDERWCHFEELFAPSRIGTTDGLRTGRRVVAAVRNVVAVYRGEEVRIDQQERVRQEKAAAPLKLHCPLCDHEFVFAGQNKSKMANKIDKHLCFNIPGLNPYTFQVLTHSLEIASMGQ